ncbi:hypothetical protein N2152v2_006131 [Parachlorella kessleri]
MIRWDVSATQAPQQNLTEAQQEALLRAKYGGLLPKKKQGPKASGQTTWLDHKYFDSADWMLNKQQQQQQQPQPGPSSQSNNQEGGQRLAPKMEPSHFPPRRASQLGEGQ